MKKAVYLPTDEIVIILTEMVGYFEIFHNGQSKIVPESDLVFIDTEEKVIEVQDFKQNIFLSLHREPLSQILFSQNTCRLIPEPHQFKPLFKFLRSENNRILIADEVGLGKTIEAGMIFKEVQSRENLKISLIVVPPSLIFKWKDEFAIRFGEYFEIYNSKSFLGLIQEFEVFRNSKLFDKKIIVSYNTIRDDRVTSALENSTFFEVDFLIMDEAHTMRNSDTSTHEAARAITAISQNIVFLTATPVQNKLTDLFNILNLLDSELFMDYEYFENQVKPNAFLHSLVAILRSNASHGEVQRHIESTINEISDAYPDLVDIVGRIAAAKELTTSVKVGFIDELLSHDELSFIINRTKKKDVGRLIPRNAKSVVVTPNSSERAYYNAVISLTRLLNPHVPSGFITIMPERMASSCMIGSLQNFKNILQSGRLSFNEVDDFDVNLDEELNYPQQIEHALREVIRLGDNIGEEDSKYKRFLKLIQDLSDTKTPQIIVFSFFKSTLKYLHSKLTNAGYRVGIIHGDYKVEERYSTIGLFKNGTFDILLSSEVGSEGLDMQFANVIINYDLPWNPMRVEQRIGRIDRIGQKFDKLHIFSLCIEGSIEDRILLRLYEKLQIFEASIGELEPIIGDLASELNIPDLLELTDDEIDKVLHIDELAKRREELESVNRERDIQNLLMDGYEVSDNNGISTEQSGFVSERVKILLTEFLESHNISFQTVSNGVLVLKDKSLKELVKSLKTHLSDRREHPQWYNEERILLNELASADRKEFVFSPNRAEEFKSVFIGIASPLTRILLNGKVISEGIVLAKHKRLPEGYICVGRLDMSSRKKQSKLVTLFISPDYSSFREIDFELFMSGLENHSDTSSFETERLKQFSSTILIKRLEHEQKAFEKKISKQIDQKINSLSSYMEKRIKASKRLVSKVTETNIIRMKQSEIENLENQQRQRILELESQKKITASYKILGLIKINNE